MNLRARLSERVHIEDIREILHFIQDDKRLREEIYQLILDEDHIVSYQALWVCTHFSKAEVEWLSGRQDELIDAAMTCPHSGKRRMILNLLCQQPAANPPRVDFLDFCMERMISREEPPGVQSLCIKLAYQLTRSIPELQQELRTMLEIMEPDLLVPAIRSVRRNTLKYIQMEYLGYTRQRNLNTDAEGEKSYKLINDLIAHRP